MKEFLFFQNSNLIFSFLIDVIYLIDSMHEKFVIIISNNSTR